MLAIVDDNSKKQCVLIIDNGLLGQAGVDHLLSHEACLYVVGPASPNGAILLEIIKHLQPDTIILEESYFLTLTLGRLIEILNYPQLRILTVSAKTTGCRCISNSRFGSPAWLTWFTSFEAVKKMDVEYTIEAPRR
jgi:hypothetical protein